MLQRILHQLLGGDVDDVVVAVDNVVELSIDALCDELRRVFAVQAAELAKDQGFQVLHGVFDLRGVEIVRQRTDPVAPVGDQIRIRDHDLIGLLLAQIGELAQHIVRRAEIERVFPVAVGEALGGQEDAAEDLVLGV